VTIEQDEILFLRRPTLKCVFCYKSRWFV